MGCYADATFMRKTGDVWAPILTEEVHDLGKSYDLFAILFNVRNEWGYKHVKPEHGDYWGAPPGVQAEDWKDYSWLTLKDVLEYDYTQTVDKHGYMMIEFYQKWDRSESPSGYHTSLPWRAQKPMPCLQPDEVDAYLRDNPKFEPWSVYVEIKWTETYLEAMEWFLGVCKGVIERNGGDPSQLCVMFDWSF